jgi:hypothetical protein
MTMTLQEERTMFGEPIESMERMFNVLNDEESEHDNLFYAYVILSDAQMMIERGESELARQFINKSKFFMSRVMKKANARERAGTLHFFPER